LEKTSRLNIRRREIPMADGGEDAKQAWRSGRWDCRGKKRAADVALRSFAMIARSSLFAVLVAVSASIGSSRAQETPAPVVVGAPGPGPVVVEPGAFAPVRQQSMTVEAGVNFLTRSSPHRNGKIGELVNLDTDEVLASARTKDIDYRFEAGPDLTLRFHGNGGGSFDLRWVGVDNWNVGASLSTDLPDPVGTRTPVSPFAFVLEQGATEGGITAKANSYFHSFQAGRTGVVSESDDYTLTNYIGFRYIYFRDSIEIDRVGTVDNEGYGWGANNNLLGFETGLDYANHYGFLSLGAKGRIGGYVNYAHLKGSYDITVGSQQGYAPVDFRTPSDGFTGFSGVLDGGVYATVHASRNFALKVGYDVIFMTNLVLGTENMSPSLILVTPVPNNLPTVSPGELRAHGNSVVFVHGFSVTGEVSW
jgi:hypothetical protein